jgi:hypothetical protein
MFDHVALVVEPPVGRAADFPWIADIGVAKQGFRSLDRCLRPQGILVRRHRNPGAGAIASRQAHSLMTDVTGYDWERILLVIITSLTRFSPLLKRLDDDPKQLGVNAARFIATVHNLMALIGQEHPKEQVANKAICVTFVADCFDSFDHEPVNDDDQYYGLQVPLRPMGGLLEWVASGQKWVDYLADGRDSASDIPASFDEDEIVENLYRQLGFSGSARTVKPDQDFDSKAEDNLRLSVVQATEAMLRLLGWDPTMALFTKPNSKPSPKALRAAALYLLDQLLQQRYVLTVADIMLSKSLVDIGQLDLSKLERETNQG